MPQQPPVNARQLSDQLFRLTCCLREMQGDSPAGNARHRAQVIAAHINQQISTSPNERIVADDGNDLIGTYLEQIRYYVPWPDGLGGDPKPDDVAQLERWTTLLRQAVEGEPPTGKSAHDAASGSPQLTGEAKALALLVEHPDWTDTKIASEANVSRQSLYRWPKFVAAREAMKQEIGRGEKSRSGAIEQFDRKLPTRRRGGPQRDADDDDD